MSKYIEIRVCRSCYLHGNEGDEHICYNAHIHPRKIGKEDINSFPKWCPLKSLMGTKKTVNELRSALEYCVKNAQPSFVQDVARQALKNTEIV